MRLAVMILILSLLYPYPAKAVTGDDVVPGTACTVNKAMMMTANPAGIGGYILTCEAGQWRATITAEDPTQNQQVATKKYVDDSLADSIATIDTHTYTDIKRRVDTTGEYLPLVISELRPQDLPTVASKLCSMLSNGQYVHGKITESQRRNIHSGYYWDNMTGITHRCQNECIIEPSENRYAWAESSDFYLSKFYGNTSPGYYDQPQNMGEITTSICGSFTHPGGTTTINGECMANATSSRSSLSGRASPNYLRADVINAITCWSN